MGLQTSVVFLLICVNLYILVLQVRAEDDGLQEWNGRWFPSEPNMDLDDSILHDEKHGFAMGIPTVRCDDAKINLTLDWDGSPDAYTCYDFRRLYKPNINVQPSYRCQHIPKGYWAMHKCMNESITYDEVIPTFGTHRPLWPRYGEYRYVPVQRWLHNLEHGAIVMLYHPCADDREVNRLRSIVTGCLARHVITPYKALSPERPLAVVAWGCRLTMSKVHESLVRSFIESHALRGPEKVSHDGQYDMELLIPAEIVSDPEDTTLCPQK